MAGLTEKRIVKVSFFEPMAGKTEWYFGSIKAIFAMFSAEQIGRSYQYLHSYLRGSQDYVTSRCRIQRIALYRLKSQPKVIAV